MVPNRVVLGVVLGCAVLAATAAAQVSRRNIYSRPRLPSEPELRRLNMRLAWAASVAMDGRRDGLVRVVLDRRDLIAVTRSGEVALFDAETGVERWRTRVGKPYTILPYVAANSRSVYAFANATMYGLDRKTGARKWEHVMRTGLSAEPVADEEQVYLPGANSRFYAFYLPFVGVDSDARGAAEDRSLRSQFYSEKEAARESRVRPAWEEATNVQLLIRPLHTPDGLFVISPSGRGLGFNKVLGEGANSPLRYRFSTDGKIRQDLGQYGETAYIGADDAVLYAVNMGNGKLVWRHTAGSAISRQPVATEKDVYVTSAREGMARIDRASGEAVWKIPQGRLYGPTNAEADRFLAANNKFVYAADASGRLLVLDRRRGTRLSRLDTTDYRVPVVNELTDRVYLAANNGLIVCLHDRDQRTPLRHRLKMEQASAPVLRVLEQPVNELGSKPVTLREALTLLRTKYKLRYLVAIRAFKEAGVPDVQEKLVNMPRIENKPLKAVLADILKQVNATYQPVEDAVLIVPGKKK
jgi:outer membrane protein assembly factor BamB